MQPNQPCTIREMSSLLIKTFAPYAPKTIEDVTDKGASVIEFVIPNPHEPRFSVSVEIREARGYVDTCSLWFGRAEISGHMDKEDIIPAITSIISGELVAILQYKNQDAYDDHRPSGKQWLYQITDDEDDDTPMLDAMKEKLQSPPTLMEKISGKMIGVFEIFDWEGSEIIIRK